MLIWRAAGCNNAPSRSAPSCWAGAASELGTQPGDPLVNIMIDADTFARARAQSAEVTGQVPRVSVSVTKSRVNTRGGSSVKSL